jgi:hypothetical protein
MRPSFLSRPRFDEVLLGVLCLQREKVQPAHEHEDDSRATPAAKPLKYLRTNSDQGTLVITIRCTAPEVVLYLSIY